MRFLRAVGFTPSAITEAQQSKATLGNLQALDRELCDLWGNSEWRVASGDRYNSSTGLTRQSKIRGRPVQDDSGRRASMPGPMPPRGMKYSGRLRTTQDSTRQTEEAAFLQRLAWETVQEYQARP